MKLRQERKRQFFKNSIVIDVTYRCNATCQYCQWGDNKNPLRVDQKEDFIYIPSQTLKSLETKRIVLSGGEPLLRKDLGKIISYYRDIGIESIVIITNGILLSESVLNHLIRAGLTGITFSIDAIDKNHLLEIRRYEESMSDKIFQNFENVLRQENMEIGINTVINSINLGDSSLVELSVFASENQIDFIKFQPVFDDGYTSKNAPHMLLNKSHGDRVLEIGKQIIAECKIETNHINFWQSLSATLKGFILDGESCGLDAKQQIAIRGDLKFCYWIDDPVYGNSNNSLDPDEVSEIQKDFLKKKRKCQTGMYCYCLQTTQQKWTWKKPPLPS